MHIYFSKQKELLIIPSLQWSYGITCWEIFSLGRTPYPTIPNHEIPEYVEAGNKPRKPQLCPDSM